MKRPFLWMLLMIVIMASQYTNAQSPIEFKFKGLKQIFSKQAPDCAHCKKAYSFVGAAVTIEKTLNKLDAKKPNKKKRASSLLAKHLVKFVDNGIVEFSGITTEKTHSRKASNVRVDAKRLNLHLETVLELFETIPFDTNDSVTEPLSRVRDLHAQVNQFLKK